MYSEDIIMSGADIGFMNDEKFKQAYQKCVETDKGRLLPNNYSIRWRIHTLLWASKHTSYLEGDFVDFGGGFGLFASAIYDYLNFDSLNKKYYLLDSFKGLDTETSSQVELSRNANYTKYGDWSTEIMEKFKEYKNINIIKGFIPESLQQLNTDKICFASIDLNSVNPEESALEFTWNRLVKGGIIVFDDYGFPGHVDQKNSHDRFAEKNNTLIYTCPTGQGILIK